jgi:hypothetical protein
LINKTTEGKLLFDHKNVLLKDGINKLNNIKVEAFSIEFLMSKSSVLKSGVRIFKNGKEETIIYFDKGSYSKN